MKAEKGVWVLPLPYHFKLWKHPKHHSQKKSHGHRCYSIYGAETQLFELGPASGNLKSFSVLKNCDQIDQPSIWRLPLRESKNAH